MDNNTSNTSNTSNFSFSQQEHQQEKSLTPDEYECNKADDKYECDTCCVVPSIVSYNPLDCIMCHSSQHQQQPITISTDVLSSDVFNGDDGHILSQPTVAPTAATCQNMMTTDNSNNSNSVNSDTINICLYNSEQPHFASINNSRYDTHLLYGTDQHYSKYNMNGQQHHHPSNDSHNGNNCM